jgi:hypothetical protein
MDNFMKKEEFGIPLYEPKAMVKDLLPVHTHAFVKKKREFFTTQAARENQWVPGADTYHKKEDYDWGLVSKNRFSKFKCNKRTTIAGELEIKHSKLETSSPGPCKYDNHK